MSDGRPYERMALVLQGGGAIGAYEAGAYRALDELGLRPDWVAGTSIGALNAAIVAGNRPDQRVGQLEKFWTSVSHPLRWPWPGPGAREVHHALSTLHTALFGTAFSRSRPVTPWLAPRGTAEAVSYCDATPLRRIVEDLVDFDRIGAGETRLSLGAVNVRTGRLRYFDSAEEAIAVEHVLAAMALPPACPPVEVDGELYWQGGVVSNTPLNAVLDSTSPVDTLCVMVDLFSPQGPAPSDMAGVMARLEEIGYASRTDTSLAHFREKDQMRQAIALLIEALPPEVQLRPEIRAMAELGCPTTMDIVRLTYRPAQREPMSRELDYSRLSIEEHIRAGYADALAVGTAALIRDATAEPARAPRVA